MPKEVACERADSRDLRGLQPPDATPDTFVTWASELGDSPVRLGAAVRLTDLEELSFDGYISGISDDLRDLYVTRGASPVVEAESIMHLASVDIEVKDVPHTADRHITYTG